MNMLILFVRCLCGVSHSAGRWPEGGRGWHLPGFIADEAFGLYKLGSESGKLVRFKVDTFIQSGVATG